MADDANIEVKMLHGRANFNRLIDSPLIWNTVTRRRNGFRLVTTVALAARVLCELGVPRRLVST